MQASLIMCEEHIRDTQAHQTDRNSITHSNHDSRTQTQGNGRGKGKDNDKNKLVNPCKLPNHQHHEWKDCLNYLRSDNFKGTAKSPMDFITDESKRKTRSVEGKMAETELPNSYDSDSEADEEFEMLEERLTLKEEMIPIQNKTWI